MPARISAGGSRTFVSNVANTGAMSAGIDLNGQNANLSSSFFVNNGYVTDNSNGGAGTHQLIDGAGSLVLGAGFFQNSLVGIGTFQPGNGPGSASFGSFRFSASLIVAQHAKALYTRYFSVYFPFGAFNKIFIFSGFRQLVLPIARRVPFHKGEGVVGR